MDLVYAYEGDSIRVQVRLQLFQLFPTFLDSLLTATRRRLMVVFCLFFFCLFFESVWDDKNGKVCRSDRQAVAVLGHWLTRL